MTITNQNLEWLARALYYANPLDLESHVKEQLTILNDAIEKARAIEPVAEGEEPTKPYKGVALYGDVECSLTSPFGPRKSGMHKGVDFAAWGYPFIYSIIPGTVLRAGGNRTSDGDCVEGNGSCGGGWGNFVEVDTEKGIVRYCHLDTHTITVKPGHKLTAGEAIGKQGNTGNSFGAHLHFEVVRNGLHVNPVGYVVDESGRAI